MENSTSSSYYQEDETNIYFDYNITDIRMSHDVFDDLDLCSNNYFQNSSKDIIIPDIVVYEESGNIIDSIFNHKSTEIDGKMTDGIKKRQKNRTTPKGVSCKVFEKDGKLPGINVFDEDGCLIEIVRRENENECKQSTSWFTRSTSFSLKRSIMRRKEKIDLDFDQQIVTRNVIRRTKSLGPLRENKHTNIGDGKRSESLKHQKKRKSSFRKFLRTKCKMSKIEEDIGSAALKLEDDEEVYLRESLQNGNEIIEFTNSLLDEKIRKLNKKLKQRWRIFGKKRLQEKLDELKETKENIEGIHGSLNGSINEYVFDIL